VRGQEVRVSGTFFEAPTTIIHRHAQGATQFRVNCLRGLDQREGGSLFSSSLLVLRDPSLDQLAHQGSRQRVVRLKVDRALGGFIVL